MKAAAAIALAFSLVTLRGANAPRLEDARFGVTLFAQEPEIWTPTGVAVDGEGKVFVIESHTHLPKSNYDGPKSDRIKVLEDRDGDGKAERVSVFAEGLTAAMNLLFGPAGELYVVERSRVSVLRGAGNRQTILTLKTKGDFPHNGLGGIALGSDGWLYVGFGENLGETYILEGPDGSNVSGGGEGGNIFRCRTDGTKLEPFATGFWNPFSLEFDDSGNLFAVDNDPDGRPPCRLLHVIQGGDYGYRFKYGRSGLHPFVAWDGELPGTLPMVSGTGEAPSGLIWLPRIGWPAEYANSFLGTSWGDNLLETFPLQERGSSFKSDRKILGRGELSFRPVAMAAGKDGSVYITDWADREYAVHKKGRVWKIAPKEPLRKVALKKEMARGSEVEFRENDLTSADSFVRSKAVTALGNLREKGLVTVGKLMKAREPELRMGALLSLRQWSSRRFLEEFLSDADPRVRQMAIVWGTELGQEVFGSAGLEEDFFPKLRRDFFAAATKSPVTLTLLQTYLASEQILSGYRKKSVWEQGSTGDELMAAFIKDESKPKELRELARKLRDEPQAQPVVGSPVAEPAARPKTEREWLAAIGSGGVPAEGRKLFFSERVGCAKCHRALGEGGKVGPDLTVIARASDRAKLVNSILDPSANIGPLYVTHEIVTEDGREFAGLVLDGKAVALQADGKLLEVPAEKIKSDRVSNVSLMPAGLESGLTVREFADLISFLQTLK